MQVNRPNAITGYGKGLQGGVSTEQANRDGRRKGSGQDSQDGQSNRRGGGHSGSEQRDQVELNPVDSKSLGKPLPAGYVMPASGAGLSSTTANGSQQSFSSVKRLPIDFSA
jgi:hypothetical protein